MICPCLKGYTVMFEIIGTVSAAVCYAKVIEDEAIEQVRRMCSYALTEKNKINCALVIHPARR